MHAATWVAMLDDLKPASFGIRTDLAWNLPKTADSVLFTGHIEAPADGEYTFHLTVNSGPSPAHGGTPGN